MKFQYITLICFAAFFSCGTPSDKHTEDTKTSTKNQTVSQDDFNWNPENFSDKKIVRYQIPGFDKLTTKQKTYVYYLTQAGYAGRDIIYDQNYKHNLAIRHALENIVINYKGDKNTDDWKNFMEYTKNVWFSNGIHHHYSNAKFNPKFSEKYFNELLAAVKGDLNDDAKKAMFDPTIDAKKVSLDGTKDLIQTSAVNLYGDNVTQKDVENFYAKKIKKGDPKPISYGLNSKLVKDKNGKLVEQVYRVGGKYGPALEKVVGWLEKAATVAESPDQAKALGLLIKYYKTGDLKVWDDYNILWASTTKGDIDYIHGFVEVYNDPMGYRGSFESIIQINDFDASDRMKTLSQNAQWFEDHSTILPEHKKKNVVGVSYKVVNVAGESGDASPSTPIGVNLPNANWIRATHGSKSVSLGNIIHAYDKASGEGALKEFANDEEEIANAEKYGDVTDKMGTALHEVIGHASGKINDGIGTPKETLKNYASTLEEARADIVALYYIMDPKLVELGLTPNTEAGKAEYDAYIRNGMMIQLKRLKPGDIIEEAHMRNRQLISAWAFEHGKKDNVIEKITRNGKTYFNINDYGKLRTLFGDLLRILQKIKSEGDFEAGKALVEKYGVQVDPVLHKEVLERVKKLNTPPYGGFINPKLVPVVKDGKIVDVKVEYPDDFTKQMLEYAKDYSTLPDYN